MTNKKKSFKKLYSTNNKEVAISLLKKPQKEDFDIKDKDIESAEGVDRNYALARYRELVANRKRREKLRPREPEVYHHDIYKKT